MKSDNHSTAVVIGVGQSRGLGAALVRRFAQAGLKVIAVSRHAEKLNSVIADIQDGANCVIPYSADITEENQVKQLFEFAESEHRTIDLVVYNVGNNAMVPFLEITPEFFQLMWRQNSLGGFLVGQAALRMMLPQKKGTIIFTGATASLRSRPPFTAFAAAKSSLRAVAQGMAKEFGPLGIHIAHVIIDGVINGEYARQHFPDYVSAKGDCLIEPDAIAEVYWQLHMQPASAWTHELDVRPAAEHF